MEWCSEDKNFTNFGKISLKFAVVFKSFEYICPFLSLTIITGANEAFKVLQMRYMTKIQTRKMVYNIFLTAICENFSSEFCTFSFFLYDLVNNEARKLEVVVSNLIMEKISSSIDPSLCYLAFLSFSSSFTFYLAISLSLSLFLTLLLMPHFSGCYVA